MRPTKKAGTLAYCLGIILIAAVIQLAGLAKHDRLVFPGIGEILRTFVRLLGSSHTYMLMLTTLRHLLAVLAVSTAAGVGLGLLEGMVPFVRRLLVPLMVFLRSIPMIVLVVVIMVLTRYDRVPLIASSLVLIPMISEATCEGVLRIDRELLDVYRQCSGLTPYILWKVYLPLMAGYMKQAYINAAGMGIKMVVSTEYLVQTRNSLGKAIYSSSYFNEYAEIYAYALIMILLVLALTELPLWVGRKVEAMREKQYGK